MSQELDEIGEQRNHHSLQNLKNILKKRKLVIGFFPDLGLIDPVYIFIISSMKMKN